MMKPTHRCIVGRPLTAWLALALIVIPLSGCRKPADAAVPPARAGEVWQLAAASERTDSPGALLAYINGLHVLVLDGDAVYAGTTHVRTTARAGGRAIALGNGVDALLIPAGPGKMDLRFSTGETAHMVRR